MKNTKKLTTLIRTTDILNRDGEVVHSTRRPLRIGVFKHNTVAPHLDFFATFEEQIDGKAFVTTTEGELPQFVYSGAQKIAIAGTLLEAFKRQPVQDPRG